MVYYHSLGFPETYLLTMGYGTLICGIAIVCFISDRLAKRVLLTCITAFIKRTKNVFDDFLLERNAFDRLAHVVPAYILFLSAQLFLSDFDMIKTIVERVSLSFMVLVSVLAVDSLI